MFRSFKYIITSIVNFVSYIGLDSLPFPFFVIVSTEIAEEKEIRNIRALSNQAILSRDIEALRNTWVKDLHVTLSSGDVVSSSDEMGKLFTKAFSDPDFFTYRRTPVEINMSSIKKYAAEQGKWLGRWENGSSEISIEGIYMAQWHKVDKGWRIRSELYVALSCSSG